MMLCNARTMAKVALILAGAVAASAVAWPDTRELLLAGAPLLLALICPISMIAMALMMRRSPAQEPAAHGETAVTPAIDASPKAGPPRSSCRQQQGQAVNQLIIQRC